MFLSGLLKHVYRLYVPVGERTSIKWKPNEGVGPQNNYEVMGEVSGMSKIQCL